MPPVKSARALGVSCIFGRSISISAGVLKIFVALQPCDLRKSFNGLHTLVSERLGEGPGMGALFVFSNRRHNRLKILYWDGTGFRLMTKRLDFPGQHATRRRDRRLLHQCVQPLHRGSVIHCSL